MSPATVVRSFNVGGLPIDVVSTDWRCNGAIGNDDAPQDLNNVSALPITALILLHGRTGNKTDMQPLAEIVLKYAREKTFQAVNGSQETASHELIVVTLVCFESNLHCFPHQYLST